MNTTGKKAAEELLMKDAQELYADAQGEAPSSSRQWAMCSRRSEDSFTCYGWFKTKKGAAIVGEWLNLDQPIISQLFDRKTIRTVGRK